MSDIHIFSNGDSLSNVNLQRREFEHWCKVADIMRVKIAYSTKSYVLFTLLIYILLF